MIKIVLGSLFFVSSLPYAVAKSDDSIVGANAEFGLNGNYGIVGAEALLFPKDNFDLHAGLGIGAAAIGGGGVRIYTKDDECFFLKHCNERYFIGVTYASLRGIVEDNLWHRPDVNRRERSDFPLSFAARQSI